MQDEHRYVPIWLPHYRNDDELISYSRERKGIDVYLASLKMNDFTHAEGVGVSKSERKIHGEKRRVVVDWAKERYREERVEKKTEERLT
jgi:hypothetical protein